MNLLEHLLSNRAIFFNYMKERYEVHHKSNIFLRDLLYAIQSYYEKKGQKVSYKLAEKLAIELTENLVNSGELQTVGKNTWKVNFSTKTTVKEIVI